MQSLEKTEESTPEEAMEPAKTALSRLIQRGIDLQNARQLDEAIACYEQIIANRSLVANAHNNMGVALKALGKTETAIEHYRQALAITPDSANTLNNLGNALKTVGQNEAAIESFKRALELKPDYAEAHNNLGNVLREMGQLQESLKYCTRAIELKPDYAEAQNNVGVALQKLGRVEESMAYYDRALELKPDYAEAYNNRAVAYQMLGQEEKAVQFYEEALRIKPDYAAALRQLVMVDPTRVEVSTIKEQLANPALSDEDAIFLQFALGEIYNSQKDYEQAFEHYRAGNNIKRKSFNYNINNHKVFTGHLIATYTKPFIRKQSASGSNSDIPVFILGMPRSGTTLVEQMISSHPDVHGAGELGYLADIERETRFRLNTRNPECMTLLNDADIEQMANTYLAKIRQHSDSARYITDKMPDNYLRIGLIKILFPNAHIIHCRRNPLDVCTSIYIRLFTTGDHPYAYRLDELGIYYLEYERLMSHWRELFGQEIYEIQYEQLVAEPETYCREMLDYLGLEWDDRCLEFHQNERAVLTASNMQVRQPLYTHSIDRWKRYSKGLEPLEKLFSKHLPSRTE